MKVICVLTIAALLATGLASRGNADPPTTALPSQNRPQSLSPKVVEPIYGDLPTLQGDRLPQPETVPLYFPSSGPTDFLQLSFKRVSLDINNTRLEEALKKLFAQTGQKYELDADVPPGTRVTLRIHNVSLTTALQCLVEQVNLGWTLDAGAKEKPAAYSFKIGKQLATMQTFPILRSSNYYPMQIPWQRQPESTMTIPWSGISQPTFVPLNGYDLSYWQLQSDQNLSHGNPPLTAGVQYVPLTGAQETSQDITTGTNGAPKSNKVPLLSDLPIVGRLFLNSPHPDDPVKTNKIPILGDLPIVGRLFMSTTHTEHSVFTCPHCHEQVTVVRARETPSCPECGRAFQADWKVCPFDGAKRPVIAGEWRFCPVCGKLIAAPPAAKKSPASQQ